MTQERYCGHCGKLLVRRENERPGKFNVRQTCDFVCGAHLGHKKLIERTTREHGQNAEELARRKAAGLCACGKPLKVGGNGVSRKTCGERRCRGLSAASWAERHKDVPYVPWPKVTGEIATDFSGQDVVLKEQWLGTRIVADDLRQSYVGCSAAYAAGVA